MPDIPIKLHKNHKQWNAGEVAGFDQRTAEWLVDNDFGVAVEVKKTTDPKTGKVTHTVVGEKRLQRARPVLAAAAEPEPTGDPKPADKTGEPDKTGDKTGEKTGEKAGKPGDKTGK